MTGLVTAHLTATVTAAALLVLSGCVGAQDRDEFAVLIQSRGGGVSNLGVDEVLATLRSQVGGEAAVRQATFGFGETYASLEVTVDTNPLEVDDFTIYGPDVRYHEPVRDPDEAATVAVGRLAELDVEAMADRALAEFGVSSAYVTNMIVTPAFDRIQMSVESPRASGYAVFDIAGEFQELVRS